MTGRRSKTEACWAGRSWKFGQFVQPWRPLHRSCAGWFPCRALLAAQTLRGRIRE